MPMRARAVSLSAGKRLSLIDEPLACVELAPKTFDASELGQHLGVPFIGWLVHELRAQPLLRCVETVEVPQCSHAVGHAETLEASYEGSKA